MAVEVFNRHEQKYFLDRTAMLAVQSRLTEHMEPDAYNRSGRPYTIANIYYDTEDQHLIRTSLQQPRYKEKLRLRGYGVPDLQDRVFLEIKKKCSGLVNKRRSALRLSAAYEFLGAGALPPPEPLQNRQVLREISYLLHLYNLKPALYLAYDRIAYFGGQDRGLRVSFDSRIRTRHDDLRLEAGDYGRPLLDGGLWLMEIKTSVCMPLWLARCLSDYRIYPAGFSKYGAEYLRRLAERPAEQAVYTCAAVAVLPAGAAKTPVF